MITTGRGNFIRSRLFAFSVACLTLTPAGGETGVYGGDSRLRTATRGQAGSYAGRISAISAHRIEDNGASFPVDGAGLRGSVLRVGKETERWYRIVTNTAQSIETDPRDGDPSLAGSEGGSYEVVGVFSLEQIGSRWWFIDPVGNAFFPRAISKTDLSNNYSQRDPNWLTYDAFYVRISGQGSKNFAEQAANPAAADVPAPSRGGDSILIGSRRPIAGTWFALGRFGAGGKVEWSYSTAKGWRKLDCDFSFDHGGSVGLDESTGAYTSKETLNSAHIIWWKDTIPPDFQPRTVEEDSTLRYYIRAVVQQEFQVAPILSQMFEAVEPWRLLTLKYGGAENWVRAIGERYRRWGWNMAGQYSILYNQKAALAPDARMPIEPTVPLSGLAMDSEGPWRIRNVYAGVQCPPASGRLVYQGKTPDVFDSRYAQAIKELAAKHIHSNPWYLFWVPEEADELFGFNKETHLHMGYAVLSQNPWNNAAQPDAGEPKLHSKYALRDFLKERYGNSLKRLNAAWGTSYSTWETSSGDLMNGTNAWGSGSGFMDDDGRGVFAGDCESLSFQNWRTPEYPAVRRDLDDFVVKFVEKYGSILYPAVRAHTANLIALPIYSPPLFVAKAVRPYTDFLWTSFGSEGPERATGIYDALRKPMMVADYASANHDSPLDFGGPIETVELLENPPRTRVTWSGSPYRFRAPYAVELPGVPEAQWERCRDLRRTPVPVRVNWREVELAGDYSRCLQAGARIRISAPPNSVETQEKRADIIKSRIDAYVRARGSDGLHFVAGWEHWSMMDHPQLDADEHWAFGFVTASDNAYDGVEARRALRKDSNGRIVGGEEADYGAVIPKLASYLQTLMESLFSGAN